jgi:nucleoside-diphosphate-sugar epimerase
MTPTRSLPRRFRLTRVLIVGCGDVGVRIAQKFGARLRLFGTTRSSERKAQIRDSGAVPIQLELARSKGLIRAATLARHVIVLSPPPSTGLGDSGSIALAQALKRAQATCSNQDRLRVSYISTTGVYGDCSGRVINEQAPLRPSTLRAQRRVAAERIWHQLSKTSGVRLAVLRAPGIYANDRLPLERLKQGLPALLAQQDVYTNHIHANDLAQMSLACVLRIKGRRNYNATDASELRMGDYFDKIAEHFGLPKPPRVDRKTLEQMVSPMMLSFMNESRRIDGSRLLREQHLRLLYPTIESTLLEL